jgi:hypothetical protein
MTPTKDSLLTGKRRNSIYEVRSVEAFEAEFSRVSGKTWREVARSAFGDTRSEVGWLLVASIAEGLGHPASDVDVLVVPPLADSLRPSSPEAVLQLKRHPSGDALLLQVGDRAEALNYIDGVEINWEVLDAAFAVRVRSALNGVTQLLSGRAKSSQLPILSARDTRTLHRLKTGWILGGEKTVAEWRSYLLIDILPEYLTVVHYMNFCEMLEDIRSLLSMQTYSEPVLMTMWQMACRDALMCVNASSGVSTNPSEKWVSSKAAELPEIARPVYEYWYQAAFAGGDFLTASEASICGLERAVEVNISSNGLVAETCRVLRKLVHYSM